MFAAPVWAVVVLQIGPVAAQVPVIEPPVDRAAVAYQAALDLHAAGDLKGALASMRESYEISQRDELLYNIARIEAELGDCSASLADYRRYVERVPTGRFQESARAAAHELEATCSSTTSVSLESPPDTPVVVASTVRAPSVDEQTPRPISQQHPDATNRRMLPWLGWSAVATGGLAGLGAVYFTLKAVQARNAFQHSVDIDAAGGPRYDLSLQDKQHTNQRWAQVLGVTGGTLAAGGVLWLVLAPRERGQGPPNAVVYVAPGLLAASWRQSF